MYRDAIRVLNETIEENATESKTLVDACNLLGFKELAERIQFRCVYVNGRMLEAIDELGGCE